MSARELATRIEAAEADVSHRPCDNLRPPRVAAESCLMRARKKRWKGQDRTPTQHQDPQAMCDECAMAWHLTMAGVYARRLATHEAQDEDRKRGVL